MTPDRIVAAQVTMKWSEKNQAWLLHFDQDFWFERYRGMFAFDFEDCEAVRYVFSPLKDKIVRFDVIVTKGHKDSGLNFTMPWSEEYEKWELKFLGGKLAYRFWNCGTTQLLFSPVKGELNECNIRIRRKE